jgi:hypothetical protein
MKILLTGINNYLGNKLKTYFLEENHDVTCLVRNKIPLLQAENSPNLSLIYGDLIRDNYSNHFPEDLDAAYYFSNYTSEQGGIYQELELLSLQSYIKKLRRVNCAHLIYVIPLRSPINENVKELLRLSYIPFTVVRTSNIIGKSSALMQVFEHLSNELVIISNSRLAKSRCQPIALSDALTYLDFIAHNPVAFNQSFDIGGPDILNYREMLEHYLKFKNIHKAMITLPFVHVSLSSFWLSRSSGLPKSTARAFSENIKGDILCEENRITDLFPHQRLHFKESLRLALD